MKRHAAILIIILTAVIVQARPVRGISLEKDIPDANVFAVVKVANIETTAAGIQFGQFRVDELNISCSVMHAIKGDYVAGDTLDFLHRKAAPPPRQTAIINGFSSFRFQPQHNYLVILIEDKDGRLQLPAPEAFDIPEFSDAVCKLFSRPEQDGDEVTNAVALLFLSLMSEDERPEYSLKSLTFLNQTRQFREMLREEDSLKSRIVERLVQIKNNVNDWKSLAMIHQSLPQFNEYRYLDEAVDYVLDEANSESDRFNAVSSWFQNYPDDLEVKAYRKIVNGCQNESIRENAQERLSLLWDLPIEVEKQFQRLLDASDETFTTDTFIELLSECQDRRPTSVGHALEAPSEPEKWHNLHQKIIIRLKTALESEQKIVRFRAAIVLNHYNEKSAIPVLVKAVDDKSPRIRTIAIAALGEKSVFEAYDVIIKRITDKISFGGHPDYTMPAQAACYALGQLRTPDAIHPLIEALDDKDIQSHAIKALNEIRNRGFSSYNRGSSIEMRSAVFTGLSSRRYSLHFPEDPGNDLAKWKRWGAWYLLKDEKVNVRIYSDWDNHPADFSIEQTSIENHRIQLGVFKSKKNAVIVVLPDDQNSVLLKQLLKQRMYAADTTKGLYDMPVPYYDNLDRPDIKGRLDKLPVWYLDDALGNPIEGAKIELFLYRYKGPRIRLGLYQSHGTFDNFLVDGNVGDKEFIVSHPNYGIASAQIPHMLLDAKPHIILPLVPVDSEAADRAVWGYIVDTEGHPIAGAQVVGDTLRLLGGIPKQIYAFSHTYRSLSDESGFFRYYLPLAMKREPFKLDTNLISRKSIYYLRVEPPDFAYSAFTGNIQNGQETVIELNRKAITEFTADIKDVDQKQFHQFEFYDQHGVITGPEDLKAILVDIVRPDQPKITLRGSELIEGMEVPNGTYKARLAKMSFSQPRYFPVMEVTDESPEKLIFAMELLTYTGQVLHAHTKEPMVGVFVMAMNSSGKGNLSMITDEQWDALHALPENPAINSTAFRPIRDIYGFENIVRTDNDGHFRLVCAKGETPYGFIFFEQDYVGQMHRRYILEADDNGVVEISTKKMYPAAKVFFRANSDKKHLSIAPKWVIDDKMNLDWVKDFLECGNGSEKDFTYDKWVRHNQVQSVYVPADVTLKLRLRTPYEDTVEDYTFPQEIYLAQGDEMDLGECRFDQKVSFYVRVVDADGRPLDGVPVRKRVGRSYQLNVSTDSNGIAELWASVGSEGQVCVCGWDIDQKQSHHLVNSVSYKIQGRQDEGSTFTLKLSDEMLALLFNSSVQ